MQMRVTGVAARLALPCALCLLLLPCVAGRAYAKVLLPAEEAFVVRAQLQAGERTPSLRVDFDIAPGYYLYKERIGFSTDEGVYDLGEYRLPQGVATVDEFFGDTVIYRRPWSVEIPVMLRGALASLRDVTVELQGCSEKPAVCYPPESRVVQVDALLPTQHEGPATTDRALPLIPVYSDQNALSDYLQNASGWLVIPLFWFLGVLLSLTPCILPMVPILGGILLHGSTANRRRTALYYVCGISVAYGAAGVAAAFLGQALQAYLQQPWVLLFVALLLLTLALAMFDVLHFRWALPWQNKLDLWQRRLSGGSGWGVFAVGWLSAWVVSPCVTPPLVGALIYIANSGDVFLGAWSLMALGFGMGLPLLLLGFAVDYVPRSGRWMMYVQRSFALLLVLSAALLAERGFAGLNYAGGSDTRLGHDAGDAGQLHFEPAHSTPELQAAVSGHPDLVMAKVFATWCSACLDMERSTFADERVLRQLGSGAGIGLVVSDVSANDKPQRELMRRYQLFGPPALLFFYRGVELRDERMVGYVGPDQLLERLNAIAQYTGSPDS